MSGLIPSRSEPDSLSRTGKSLSLSRSVPVELAAMGLISAAQMAVQVLPNNVEETVAKVKVLIKRRRGRWRLDFMRR